MNELELINRIRAKVPLADAGIELGIGDDCAIFRPAAGEDLLFTTDMLIEGVHFRRETHPADAIGWKALARGLSDIAAMGGTPRFCLLSLALAPWSDEPWIEAFYGGFLRLATETGTALAGGDLAHAEQVACDVVVCGAVETGKALRRDGAWAGDRVYVSGRLGGSALGLRTGSGEAWERHLRPEPRLRLGRFLRENCAATAAMDLSDGLSLDLHRLCLASGVSAELTEVPVFAGATLEDALDGGEDYELLFTVPAEAEIPGDYEGILLTQIGVIEAGDAGMVRLAGNPLEPRGYDHFRRQGGPLAPPS